MTRVIGEDAFLGAGAALRLAAGRFADGCFADDFDAEDFFALDFLIAGPRRADDFAPDFRVALLRLLDADAERFALPARFAERFDDFFAAFFAPDFLPPPDFARDFLARVAISLTPVESVAELEQPGQDDSANRLNW